MENQIEQNMENETEAGKLGNIGFKELNLEVTCASHISYHIYIYTLYGNLV